jgi:hypothetical protein
MSDARRGDVIGIVVSAVLALLALCPAAACPPPGKIWDVGGVISVTITAPADNSMVAAGSNVTCTATASDPDHWTQDANGGNEYDDIASYTWSAKRNNSDVGTFPNGNTASSVTWQAPDSLGDVTITCTVNDKGEVTLPDGGSRNDEPGSASVTVKVITVDLWYGGACVTDETQDTIVGRPVCMYALVSPEDVEVTAQQWSVPGYAIANYTADEDSATVTPLSGLSGSNMVGYYWVDGGDGRQVTYTATVGGQQFSATTTFNVKRPTASITATTGEVAADDALGAWKLHFGIPNGGKGSDGIYFERTLTEPAGFEGGTAKWVQVVDYFLLRRRLVNTWEYIVMSLRLDTAYPYSANASTQDSPSNSLSAAFNRYTREDEYSMYLMYRPASGGIDVPLRKVSWSWSGQASRVGGGPGFALDDSDHSANPSDEDCTDHPEWYLNANNPPDWKSE